MNIKQIINYVKNIEIIQVPDLEEQEFMVQSVHFHQDYNVGVYLNNDIAVVRVKAKSDGRGIRFGDRVVPACLPHSNVVYGDHLNCTVYGWGSTGITQPGYTRYLQVSIMGFSIGTLQEQDFFSFKL